MKGKYMIGAALIALCLGVGIFSLRSSLTPYVSFEEAKTSGRTVQVAGALVKGSSQFDKETGYYNFVLHDNNGGTLDVETAENLPGNFEDSTTVVAIGNYGGARFTAERVLVKCPSKYERDKMDNQHPGETPPPKNQP